MIDVYDCMQLPKRSTGGGIGEPWTMADAGEVEVQGTAEQGIRYSSIHGTLLPLYVSETLANGLGHKAGCQRWVCLVYQVRTSNRTGIVVANMMHLHAILHGITCYRAAFAT